MFDFIADMIRKSMEKDQPTKTWIYSQSTGKLWNPDGEIECTGYSGFGAGKNNPEVQHIRDVGPIPRGDYTIGEPYDSPETVGPLAIPLTPIDHDCLGRTNMLAHGDSKKNPGMASKGCICVERNAREKMAKFVGDVLRVIE